jgi:hypothetical protein
VSVPSSRQRFQHRAHHRRQPDQGEPGVRGESIEFARVLRAVRQHASAPLQADNGFGETVSAAGLPGYDAVENHRRARAAQPGPSSATNMSGAPELPQAGGGEAGRKP